VARVIAGLGGEVRAIYPVGGPIGDLLRRLADAEDLARDNSAIARHARELHR
jgi:6-phosphofructokinase 2